MNRQTHFCRSLFAVLSGVAVAVLSAAPAEAQNLFNNGEFSSGFTGWTQRNTSNGVGSPGFVWSFQTNPNLPASSAARFVVGQQVYQIGVRAGVELVQYPNLQNGATYEVTYDWAAVAHPQYINGEGGIFEILVDGQSIAYDHVGIIASGTTVRRSLTVQFTAQSGGAHEVGARISRPHTVDQYSPTQYVDNFSLTQVGGAPLTLRVSGTCPGMASFTITGATPSGYVGVVTSSSTGRFIIPSRMTCAGTQLNLSPNGIYLLFTARADANGYLSRNGTIDAQHCGWVYQAVDAATCRVSQ